MYSSTEYFFRKREEVNGHISKIVCLFVCLVFNKEKGNFVMGCPGRETAREFEDSEWQTNEYILVTQSPLINTKKHETKRLVSTFTTLR